MSAGGIRLPSTTSAPATARSPTCATCPSTSSNWTARSSSDGRRPPGRGARRLDHPPRPQPRPAHGRRGRRGRRGLRRAGAHGCDHAQGYHMSKPLPAADLDRWLAERLASTAPAHGRHRGVDCRCEDSRSAPHRHHRQRLRALEALLSRHPSLTLEAEYYRAERDSWMGKLALGGAYLLELFSFPDTLLAGAGRKAWVFGTWPSRSTTSRRRARNCWRRESTGGGRVDPNTGKAMFFFKDPDGLPLEIYEH